MQKNFFITNTLFLSIFVSICFINHAKAMTNEDIDILSSQPSQDEINLNIKKNERQVIQINKPAAKIDNNLYNHDATNVKASFDAQKQLDVDDIKKLWEATVERNTVIKFALKKLAAPPEQRFAHSTIMAKSVSALISGVAIVPSMLGVDNGLQTASLASGSLARRALNNKVQSQKLPMTDTELIQLAGLVEDLQNQLIKNYYDYKGSLNELRDCRAKLIIQNNNYATALSQKNEMGIVVSSALYDKQLYQEAELCQTIKLKRLELERLAGPEVVTNLNLIKVKDSGFIIQNKPKTAQKGNINDKKFN